MIADRPGLGWGVGRFAAVYPTFQRTFLAGRDADPVTDVTDHPHSEYLYWAVEAGAAGAALAGILVWLVVAAGIRSQSRQRIVPWAAGLAAVSVHAAVDVPLHLPANTALCCLLLAGFIASVGIDSSCRSHLSSRWRAALLMVALIVLVQAVRLTVVDRALRVSRQALVAGEPAIAVRVAEEGLWFEPASGELLTTLARAQKAAGQPAAALATARRAAAIQPSATLSYLMAELEAERGNLAEAEHHLRVLSQTLPGLLLPRIRLAEIYSRQGETERAKDELRSGLAQPAKISSLRQMRLRERASAQLREMEVADVR
jgi:Flp pilus assembly protein TadD